MLRDPFARGAAPDPGQESRSGARARRRDHVLLVCTGNICRSPYMEMVLADGLARAGSDSIRVDSAGTAALEGREMAAPMLEALRRKGIDGSPFRARQLSTSMVQRAGIIVTAARDHRRWVTRLDPQAASRTFTLLQVARLINAVGEVDAASGIGLEAFVRRLNDARGTAGAGSAADDIEDPWQRSSRVYRRVSRRIDTAIEPFTRALAGHL